MMLTETEWKKVRLGDIGNIITGKTPSTKDEQNFHGNIPFITPVDLQNGKHILSTERCLSIQGAKSVERNRLPANSICVSCIGNLGYVAMTQKESVTNQQINSIVPHKDYDPDFIYYLIKNLESTFKAMEGQSTTLSILNKTQFSAISVWIPSDILLQKRIAGILSAFDNKIELNRKMCKTLEAMAQALFKSWFVDFEPVKAKIAAREKGNEPEEAAMMSISGKNKSELAQMRSAHPNAYAKLAHTASLFPDAMIDSKQGKIPEGWNACYLRDVTQQITKRLGEKECKVLSAVNTGELVLSEDHFNKQVFSQETNKYILVEPNSYAYNPSRINIGSLGRNKFDLDGCVSPIYVVFQVSPDYIDFFDQYFASNLFRDEVTMRASGSVRQALNYADFGHIAIQYPPKEIIFEFNQKKYMLNEISLKTQSNIRNLTQLRDNCLSEFFANMEENK